MEEIEIQRIISLQNHLQYNFYPPISHESRKAIKSLFNRYWKKEISLEELQREWSISFDDLYNRFGYFLNEEDLEGV